MKLAELLASAFLLWYAISPFQNYELMTWIAAGCGAIWLLALLFWRTRALVSTSLLFHFSLILSFYLRAAVAQGWLYNWFVFIALTQWMCVLWLTATRPEEKDAPSLFLVVSLLSPLLFGIFNPWESPFVGYSLWALLVARSAWISHRQASLPLLLILFLALALLSVPFSFYAWRNIQFFILNCVCVLLYLALSKTEKRLPVYLGYLHLSLMLVSFGLSREIYLLRSIGTAVLDLRMSLVMHHNLLVPVLLLIAAMLIQFRSEIRNRVLGGVLLLNLILILLLLFLTYSRNGWAALFVFAAVYAVLKKLSWKKLLPAAAISAVLFGLLFIVNKQVRTRTQDLTSVSERIFCWKTGLQGIRTYPIFGSGWFNYYSHAPFPTDTQAEQLKNLFANETFLLTQDHSALLDMAEFAGVPFAILFFLILARHITRRGPPLLAAALAAITFHSLFDSAITLMPSYLHLWILLALLSPHPETRRLQLHGSIFKTATISLAVLAGLLPISEDRFLMESSFQYRNHEEDKALRLAQIARICAPLDAAPLEQIKEIYLSLEKVSNAENVLRSLQNMKKDFAPYFTQLGRVRNDFALLRRGQTLDPYSVLNEDVYVALAADALERKNDQEFRRYVSLAFLYEINAFHMHQTKALIKAVPEEEFFSIVVGYANAQAQSDEDWCEAMYNFYRNLNAIGEPALAQKALERSLLTQQQLPQDWTDFFCKLLAGFYSNPVDVNKLRALQQLCSPRAVTYLQARQELLLGNYPAAYRSLKAAQKLYRYDEISDAWIRLWIQTGERDFLRRNFETLEKLPSTPFDVSWRNTIAGSYLEERNYTRAAQEFHKLSFYNYEDPRPHWKEAWVWHLAKDAQKAEQANRRLHRLVQSNWFTDNLYRGDLQIGLWDGAGVWRVAAPTPSGGMSWRTGILAHAPTKYVFPADRRFRFIRGEIGILSDMWVEDTDGVTFEIANNEGKTLFLMHLNPREDFSQRRWIPFEWHGEQPEAITLLTHPEGNNGYDWAIWCIHEAQ